MENSDQSIVPGQLVLNKEEDTEINEEELEIKEEVTFFEENEAVDSQGEKRSISPYSHEMASVCKRPWPSVEETKYENKPATTCPNLCRDSSNGSRQQTSSSESSTVAQMVIDAGNTQPLTKQTKQVVMNIYDFFRLRHQLLSETELQTKVAAAAGISMLSVQTVIKQAKDNRLDSPTLDKIGQTRVMDCKLDSCEGCMRKEILSFYERGEIPTSDTLFELLKESSIDFRGGRSTLNKIIKKIGFRYLKAAGERHILMEKLDVIASRCRFLRTLDENRNSSSPRSEIYIAETVCHMDYQGTNGSKLKTGKVVQFIIIHAGGEMGFVPGCLYMFKPRISNKGQYKRAMTPECFQTWFKNQLLPNIPNNSLIVMDNASCYSKVVNTVPNRCMKKSDIIQWLEENNISHDKSFSKVELLHLANCNKQKQVYEIDLIAHDHGHEVLRLPPHHNHLNPLEVIWHQVKSEIKRKSSEADQTLQTAEQIIKDAVARVTTEDWKMCIHCTRETEEDYKNKDKAMDYMVENLTITQDESSTDEED